MRPAYDPRTFKGLTFAEAVGRFLKGSDSPRAYLERCLAAIAEREPVVRAWVALNEAGARIAADESTRRYEAGRPMSPIDGMPIGIKDLFETKDLPTQMGCAALSGNFPRRDSALVQALRTAGAIVLGKTVTTELGLSHPGPTTNPFDPSRTPGGSSSGSAAAVAAGMIPVAIGSQVGGSVIRPASYCGNVAIKPTFGALNRGERQGYSHSHVGVHANSLGDTWRVAAEISGRVGGDPGHPGLIGAASPPLPSKPNTLLFIQTEGWATLDGDSRSAFQEFLNRLAQEGVHILTPESDRRIGEFENSIAEAKAISNDITAFEARWNWENLAAQHPGKLSDRLIALLHKSRDITLEDYRRRLSQRHAAWKAFESLASLGEALITLASPGPAPVWDPTKGRDAPRPTGDITFNVAASILHAPAISLPLLAVHGLPLGVQIIGQKNEDFQLTGHAAWILSERRDLAVSWPSSDQC